MGGSLGRIGIPSDTKIILLKIAAATVASEGRNLIGAREMLRSFRALTSSKLWPGYLEWSALSRYCAGIVVACGSVVLSRLTQSLGEVQCEPGLLLSAIAISGWWGGRGPAIVATVIAALISGGFLADPNQFLLWERPEQNLSWLLLVIEGSLFCWISNSLYAVEWPLLKDNERVNNRNARSCDSTEIDYKWIVEGVKGCAHSSGGYSWMYCDVDRRRGAHDRVRV